jgi:hypothetical protein
MTRLACGLPREWLVRMWRGHDPERSGELQILPQVPHFVGAGLPHVGPWKFTEDVPMLWYGPGHIKAVGRVQRPVTLADIAPTEAALLGSSFEAPDGRPMREALIPPDQRDEAPRLVVILVWDGAGRNVLAEWPASWPDLQSLIPQGAWYENATVGSSPTSSAQDHATIGTGAFPRNHKMVGHSMRIGGQIVPPWKDPSLLELPTFGDVYDRQMQNEPLVGLIGTVPIQLGMSSRGAFAPGGDRDVAVLRVPGNAETLGEEGVSWRIPDQYKQWYRFPKYANDLPPLRSYVEEVGLDSRDGQRDGLWRGRDIFGDELLGGFHTPARVPYQDRLIEEVIRREGFGNDQVPDLLYINHKLIDTLGHLYGIQAPEIRDSLEVEDEYLGRFIDFLDEQIGPEQWVLGVTADHGSLESTATTGAFQISAEGLHSSIQETFDLDEDSTDVVEQVKQTEIFINTEELEENGATLADVAGHVMSLRQRDVPIEGLPVPNPDHRVFRAAFPSETLADPPCLPAAAAAEEN